MKSVARLIVSIVALSLLAFHPRLAGQTTARLDMLYSFNGADGAFPNAGSLVQGGDGNFYGTTKDGGASRQGTVFQITPGGTLTTLHIFTGTGTDGAVPLAGLIQGSDGNFYGTTKDGGASGKGTIFQITPAGAFTILHSFTGAGTDGASPLAGLMQGNDGSFYGTTSTAGGGSNGTVFQITPAGALTTLYSFAGTSTDGGYPEAGLVQGSDGNFYGTTSTGGGGNNGTVFRITPTGGRPATLYSFAATGTDGSNPNGLIQGKDGNFYGTTFKGGGVNAGVIFKITPDGVGTTLHSFTRYPNEGGCPVSGLVQGGDGNFYGTTQIGGSSRNGTLFQVTPAGALTTLYSFGTVNSSDINRDGAQPYAGLVQGSDGYFYGTTFFGGSNGKGTVFRLTVSPAITSASTASGVRGKAITPYAIAAANAPSSYDAAGLPPGLSVDTNTGQITGTPTDAGTFQVTLSATNAAGTGTGVLTYTITVDAPPVITSANKASGTQGQAFSYQITATNDPTSFDAMGLPPGISINPQTGVIAGSTTGIGTFPVTLSASNSFGTGTATLMLTINDASPVVTSVGTASGTVGKSFSYQITAANNPTSFDATGLPSGIGVNTQTGAIAGSTTQAGTFPVTLSASNAAGKGTAKLTLAIAAASPVITSEGAASAKQGETFSYQIAATNGPTGFDARGLPPGISVNPQTGAIAGSTTQTGTFQITLLASNSFGKGTAKLTLTINAAPHLVINSAAPPAGQVGVAYKYRIKATNDPTIFYADGLPPGLAVNVTSGKDAGLISGVPSQAGVFTVNLSASNATSTDRKSYSLTILPAAPVITSFGSASGTVGQPFSYTITATNRPTSFGVLGLGDGLKVDVSTDATTGKLTAVIAGTPTVAKTLRLTLKAANRGGTSSADLLVQINAANAPRVPQIRIAANATATVGQAYQFPIVATNFPANFASDPSPPFPGLTLDPSTGVISGTPTRTGNFTAALTASNANGIGPTALLTLNVLPAPEGIYGFNFASPPAQSQLVNGDLVPIYVQVLSRPNKLKSLRVFAYDNTARTSTKIGESNTSINKFNWLPRATTSTDDYTLFAVATDTSGVAKTFALPVTVVPSPSRNPVSSIELLPDVSDKTFVPGSTVTLVPVTDLAHTSADTPVKQVSVYNAVGKQVGNPATSAQFTDIKTGSRVFPPISYPVKSAGVTFLTATVTNENKAVGDLSRPSEAVYLPPSNENVDLKSLTCKITTPSADDAAVIPADEPLTFTAEAKRNDGSEDASSVSYYVDGVLAGSSARAPFKVKTRVAAGTHTLTAIATDNHYKVPVSLQADPVTLTAKLLPVITSVKTASAMVGKAFSYQITATNSPTSYGVLGLPPGLKVDGKTGIISGTPTKAGTFTLTLNAANSVGKGSDTLTLTVGSGF